MHSIQRAGRLSEPLRYSEPPSRSNAGCTEPVLGMVYKWGGTDGCERCLGVQGHWLPLRGVEWSDTTSRPSTRVLQT